jgi:hypothetical protein
MKKRLSKNKSKSKTCQDTCKGCALYFFGFLGSVIYYIQSAATFGQGVVGFLKALVWPVFLVYELLVSIGA